MRTTPGDTLVLSHLPGGDSSAPPISTHTHFRATTMDVHLSAGAFLLLVLTISGESVNHSLVELLIKGLYGCQSEVWSNSTVAEALLQSI